jgi:hypothetical protein
VTRTASNGFYYCSGITDLHLPEGLTVLGDYSFIGCTSLIAVNIPESLTSIMEEVFGDCLSLGGTIEIPRNVASIGFSAFMNCYAMTAIHVDWNNAYFSSSDGEKTDHIPLWQIRIYLCYPVYSA